MTSSPDVEELADHARSHVDRAVQATDNANPSTDIQDVDDLYELIVGMDDMPTYTVELELHEFEFMQLVSGMLDGLDRMQNADELAFKSNMLAKLIDACPEHVERLEQFEDELGGPRGYQ